MGELVQKQQQFAKMVGALIQHIYAEGYELTLGEVLRTEEQAEWNAKHGVGIRNSLHCSKLAIDIYVWKDDHLIATPEVIGEWWEAQGGSWGGRFSDPCHFSLAYNGRR